VHFSSKTDDWPTPLDFFDELNAEFAFTLDPCATPDNAKCPRFFTQQEDGLAQVWTGRVFMNPPYGREIAAWIQKAWEASQTTAELVVCLIPARTDTRYWHDYVTRGEVRFIRGRLKFGDATTSAPFPSAVVVFRNPTNDTMTRRDTSKHKLPSNTPHEGSYVNTRHNLSSVTTPDSRNKQALHPKNTPPNPLSTRARSTDREPLSSAKNLVDATEVAVYLGVHRSWVYENAARLGARRLGDGPRARLRFDLAEVDERLSCLAGRGSDEDAAPMNKPLARRERARSLGTAVELLPIRGLDGRRRAA
jgi:site-specific DNA-methyltransferase (adenine-specific)